MSAEKEWNYAQDPEGAITRVGKPRSSPMREMSPSEDRVGETTR